MLGSSTFISDEEYKMVMRNRQVKQHEEYILLEFDNNMRRVIEDGYEMIDRTGTGVKYLPGITTTVDISERVPVPTRRKTAWKSMLKEYLWFLTGSDKIDDLNKMGSKVWDFWRDEEWATNAGFQPDSIGYGYGPNLIHCGGDLTDLENKPGFNQMDYVINELKNNPNSRRILFTFWRGDKTGKNHVRIHPCHHTYQFIVEPNETGEMKNLSCVMFQRSSDMFVGNLSTNLQGTAFYTYMIAQQVGMKPSKVIHCSGHAHVYLDHIDLVKEYLDRPLVKSPKLILNKKDSIYDYTVDDFILEEYEPLEKMIVPVSV